MRITVFGSTSRTGRHVLAQAESPEDGRVRPCKGRHRRALQQALFTWGGRVDDGRLGPHPETRAIHSQEPKGTSR